MAPAKAWKGGGTVLDMSGKDPEKARKALERPWIGKAREWPGDARDRSWSSSGSLWASQICTRLAPLPPNSIGFNAYFGTRIRSELESSTGVGPIWANTVHVLVRAVVLHRLCEALEGTGRTTKHTTQKSVGSVGDSCPSTAPGLLPTQEPPKKKRPRKPPNSTCLV